MLRFYSGIFKNIWLHYYKLKCTLLIVKALFIKKNILKKCNQQVNIYIYIHMGFINFFF